MHAMAERAAGSMNMQLSFNHTTRNTLIRIRSARSVKTNANATFSVALITHYVIL